MRAVATGIEAFDAQSLLLEVERYLAAVETFRQEGREPCWVRESSGSELEPELWESISSPVLG